ncbi:MAG: ATP-dependent helicase, partial [Aeromicrobium sp.]
MPEVGADLRSRFDVVLLDEYQDTSVAQRDLLRALFSGADPESGRGHGVTAVGDPAQGIYGWRGAAATNLLEFLQDFPTRDGSSGVQHTLNVTRRCAPEVIGVANRIAAPFYATTDAVTELQAAEENAPGSVTVALHETVVDEIADLVERVKGAHEGGTPWPEIAILVRATSENGRLVEALRAAGVPVEVVGLQGLLHQPEVRDVLSVLALLHDVTANPATLRLLTGPRWRIGLRDLALLGRRASRLGGRVRGVTSEAETADEALARELADAVAGVDPVDVVSLIEAVEDPGDLDYSTEARQRFAELAGLIKGLRAHMGEPLVDLARRVVAHLDLDVELMIRADRIGPDNISALLDAIAGYAEHDRYADLAGLLAYLDAEDEYAGGLEVASPTDADSVKLLTAHRSKGLEYEAVFVPLASRTVFPNERGRPRWVTSGAALPISLRGDRHGLIDIAEWSSKGFEAFADAWRADALLEEHRLGYVAFTRAKRLLHVSGHHWGPTQVQRRGPSDFLQTVHAWVLERDEMPTTWISEEDAATTNPHLTEGVAHAWPAPLAGME